MVIRIFGSNIQNNLSIPIGIMGKKYEKGDNQLLSFVSGFSCMKRLRLFLLPPGWDASVHLFTWMENKWVHRRVSPSIKFSGTHLYTRAERHTLRGKRLVQEHNTMSPARARTRTARSWDERTNRKATVPPKCVVCTERSNYCKGQNV